MLPVSGAAQLVACIDVRARYIDPGREGGVYLGRSPAFTKLLCHKTVLEIAEASALFEVVLGEEHVPCILNQTSVYMA